MSEILGVVRASSWPDLFDCPFRWYARNVLGMRSPSSSAAHIGTSIHAGAAAFDKARIDGNPIKPDDAVSVAVDTLNSPVADVQWDAETPRPAAERIARRLTNKYCAEFAPTRKYRAVELTCKALDVATKHGIIRLTGTTDRVRELPDGRAGISDMKSGKNAVDSNGRAMTKGHHLQLGVYQIMTEVETGEPMTAPAEIIGLKTTSDGEIANGEIADVKTPLLGTDEHPGLIEIAAGMLKSGAFPGNPKSILCSEQYCVMHARCPYRD